jgi:hypothetical protein
MSDNVNKPEDDLDCGGKRSTTPLSHATGSSEKAPSPLRSAGAVQDAGWLTKVAIIAAAFCLLVGSVHALPALPLRRARSVEIAAVARVEGKAARRPQ